MNQKLDHDISLYEEELQQIFNDFNSIIVNLSQYDAKTLAFFFSTMLFTTLTEINDDDFTKLIINYILKGVDNEIRRFI